MKLKSKKERQISTENLYIALIGNIDSQIVSEDIFINKGENAKFYTIVKEEEDRYKDLYNNVYYNFRDENENYTILRMAKYPTSENFIALDTLREELTEYNNSIENEINKYNKNKLFVRTKTKN